MPGTSPSLVSPCPHIPACPPPMCLPSRLRAQPVQASLAKPAVLLQDTDDPTEGYETDAGYVRKFAGTMEDSATGVDTVKQWTPRFEGWNLIPMAGVPIVGLMFVNRLNTIADTWRDSAGILSEVLRTDSGKIYKAADNYVAAERSSTVE
ncbi:MAG TPA: hypothetical protein VM347_05650 [Nonomuraea sp.]|nr:hypothetical protein [Nonomuraea sp.]